MKRPIKDFYYLGVAEAVSRRSTCLKRNYGAIIVNNDEIVSTGYNGNPRHLFNCCDIGECNRINKPHNSGDYSDCYSVHAEQNAIISAARKDMIGGTLYLYGEDRVYDPRVKDNVNIIINQPEPCPICMRMILNAGIERIVTYADSIKENVMIKTLNEKEW